jgi:TonB family protein
MSKNMLGLLMSGFCIAVAASFPLQAQTPREITTADSFAHPLLVIQPRFPANTPPEFTKVEVEVAGTIGADGKIRDTIVSAPAGHKDFENDVIEVTRMWRFIPAIDREACEPKDAPGKVVVTFEVRDAKREIYVTLPAGFKAPRSTGDYTPVHSTAQGLTMKLARQIVYPDKAKGGGGVEGYVLALAQIGADGSLKKSRIIASTPNDVFNRTVQNAIDRATFTRGDKVLADRPACVVIPFSFCVRGSAKLSMPSKCIDAL